MWYHQESNRGHKDFQSFALPTELWHHTKTNACFLICGCKGSTFISYLQIFYGISFVKMQKNAILFCIVYNLLYLCIRFRDLAQLVAHVVRDDEVAGSSPVIPTFLTFAHS